MDFSCRSRKVSVVVAGLALAGGLCATAPVVAYAEDLLAADVQADVTVVASKAPVEEIAATSEPAEPDPSEAQLAEDVAGGVSG